VTIVLRCSIGSRCHYVTSRDLWKSPTPFRVNALITNGSKYVLRNLVNWKDYQSHIQLIQGPSNPSPFIYHLIKTSNHLSGITLDDGCHFPSSIFGFTV
jgi:hypothetical protein